MNVYFYSTFNKRDNSTLRPNIIDTSQFDTHDCKLKQECSEHDPVLLLSSAVFNYVYAYIPDWHKYYYVVDVVSKANNLVEYHLSEDLLGTYRANIYATKARIMYSSTNYDTDIVDSRIKVKTSRSGNYSSNMANVVSGNGGYILNVFNTAGNIASSGICVSYLLSEFGMDKLRGWLGNTGVAAAIASYMNGSLMDAILSCIWVPYFSELTSISPGVTARNQAVIGNRYSYDQDGILFSSGQLYSLDDHPILTGSIQIGTGLGYTDFRRYEPYTTGAIYLPGVGTVGLSLAEWRGSDIYVTYHIDAITGDLKYFLQNNVGTTIVECNCNIAAQVGVGQVVTNGSGMMMGVGQAAAGAVGLVAGAATGGSGALIAGAALATVAGIANTVLSANQHTASVSGGNSNRLAMVNPSIRYYEVYSDTEDPNDASYIGLQGRPYNGVATIGSLVPTPANPIYVQCIDARVSPSATDGGANMRPNLREQQEINTFLNSGFYYE